MDLISGWLELYLFSSARILFSFFPLPLPPLQPACHAKPAAIVRQQASLVDPQQLQNFEQRGCLSDSGFSSGFSRFKDFSQKASLHYGR